MAYLTIPAATRTSAPGTADDSTKGFFRGSIVVNTATSPDTAYVCIDNTASAAVWQQIGAGGVSGSAAAVRFGIAAHAFPGRSTAGRDDLTGRSKDAVRDVACPHLAVHRT